MNATRHQHGTHNMRLPVAPLYDSLKPTLLFTLHADNPELAHAIRDRHRSMSRKSWVHPLKYQPVGLPNSTQLVHTFETLDSGNHRLVGVQPS
jgi:hypothetical protein